MKLDMSKFTPVVPCKRAILKDDFARTLKTSDGIKIIFMLNWGATVEYNYDKGRDSYEVFTDSSVLYFSEDAFLSLFHPIDHEKNYLTKDEAFSRMMDNASLWVHDFETDETLKARTVQDGGEYMLWAVVPHGKEVTYKLEEYGDKWAAKK